MISNIAGILGAIQNKGGANVSTMPISPGELDKMKGLSQDELKRFRDMMSQYKSRGDGPPKIEDLSAYSLNQVQQSLDKYNKAGEATKGKNGWDLVDNE